MKYDVIIIGGGASGLCASILIKRKRPELSVAILESQNRVLKKLLVTGNGRCNITNKNILVDAYHGENKEFCKYALEKFGYDFTETFFCSIGIPFTTSENGKVYPQSLQASSIVDALRITAEELGVMIFCEKTAKGIYKLPIGYEINTQNDKYFGKKIIIAAGGVSGGKSLIADKEQYNLLSDLGHKTIKPYPSLVQLKTELNGIKALNGLKQICNVTAKVNGKKVRSEVGELLFTKYGISGPPVLQISRSFAKTDKGTVEINLLPEYSFNNVYDLLILRRKLLKNRTAEYFFTGVFQKMIGYTLLKMSQVSLNDNIGDISDKKLKNLAENITCFSLKVTGNTGFDNAQVTAGGFSTNEFNEKSMESLKHKDIYAIGEVLDIDGDCGGFNLQWAWSSAAVAAEDICNDTYK